MPRRSSTDPWAQFARGQALAGIENEPDFSRRQVASAALGVESPDEKQDRASQQDDRFLAGLARSNVAAEERTSRANSTAIAREQALGMRQQKAQEGLQAKVLKDNHIASEINPQTGGRDILRDQAGGLMRAAPGGRVLVSETGDVFERDPSTGKAVAAKGDIAFDGDRVIKKYPGGYHKDVTDTDDGLKALKARSLSEYGAKNAQAKIDALRSQNREFMGQGHAIKTDLDTTMLDLGLAQNAEKTAKEALAADQNNPELKKAYDAAKAETKAHNDKALALRRQQIEFSKESWPKHAKNLNEISQQNAALKGHKQALSMLTKGRSVDTPGDVADSKPTPGGLDISPEDMEHWNGATGGAPLPAPEGGGIVPTTAESKRREKEAGGTTPAPRPSPAKPDKQLSESEKWEDRVKTSADIFDQKKAKFEEINGKAQAITAPITQEIDKISAKNAADIGANPGKAKEITFTDGHKEQWTEDNFAAFQKQQRELAVRKAKNAPVFEEQRAAVNDLNEHADKHNAIVAAHQKAVDADREKLYKDNSNNPELRAHIDELRNYDANEKAAIADARSTFPEGKAQDAAVKTITEGFAALKDKTTVAMRGAMLKPKIIGQQLLDLTTGEYGGLKAPVGQTVGKYEDFFNQYLKDEGITTEGYNNLSVKEKRQIHGDVEQLVDAAKGEGDRLRKDIIKREGLTEEQAADLEKEAKARPYRLSDDNPATGEKAGSTIQFAPDKMVAGMEQAIKDGYLTEAQGKELRPKLEEAQKYWNDVERFAGSASKAKALANGALKTGAFVGGMEAGFAGGSRIPGPLPVKILAGTVIGAGVGVATEQAIKALEKYNDYMGSLQASSALHPAYDQAGGYVAMAVPLPSAIGSLSRLAKIGAGGGRGAAGAAKAVAKVVIPGAASGAAFEYAIRPNVERGIYAIEDKLGIEHDKVEDPTATSIITNAVLGGVIAGKGTRFIKRSQDEVHSILMRGMIREGGHEIEGVKMAPMGLDAKADPQAILQRFEAAGFPADGMRPETRSDLVQPLTEAEIHLYKELKKQIAQMQKSGELDQMKPIFKGAEQAVMPSFTGEGAPISSADIGTVPRGGGGKLGGEGGPEEPPAPKPGNLPAAGPPTPEERAKQAQETRDALITDTKAKFANGDPVESAVADDYGIAPPQGWVKDGDFYRPDPSQAGKVAAAMTQIGEIPDESDQMRAKALVEIAQGRASQLTQREMHSVGMDTKDGVFVLKKKEQGDLAPMVRIEHGHPIITDVAAKGWLNNKAPLAAKLVGKGEVEAVEWARNKAVVDQAKAKAAELEAKAKEKAEASAKPATEGKPDPDAATKAEALKTAAEHLKATGKSHNIAALETEAEELASKTVSEEKPAAAPEKQPEAKKPITQQIAEKVEEHINSGADLVEGLKPSRYKAVSKVISRAMEKIEGKLNGGIVLTDVPLTMGYSKSADALHVNLQHLAEVLSRAETPSKMMEALNITIDEELEHQADTILQDINPQYKADREAVWSELPDEIKQRSADIYFGKPGAKFETETPGGLKLDENNAISEFLRQYRQDRRFRKTTEEALRSLGKEGVIDKIRELLEKWFKQFREFLTELGDKFPKSKERLDRLDKAIEDFRRGNSGAGSDKAPSPEAAGKVGTEAKAKPAEPPVEPREKTVTELSADKIIAKGTGKPTELSKRVREIYSRGKATPEEAKWLEDNIGAMGDPIAAAARFIVNTHFDPNDTHVPGVPDEKTEHPEHPEYLSANDKDTRSVAEATLIDDPDFGPAYYFNRIVSQAPGKGGGTKVMAGLKEKIAKTGLPLLNDPLPYGDMDMAALVKWYKKQGFEPVPGREAAGTMIWRPEFDKKADLVKTEKKSLEATENTPKSSTQLTFPHADARSILYFGKSIPKEELYDSVDPEWSDGALETEPHVTALYGLTNHEPDPVQEAISGHGPVTIKLGKLSAFTDNPDYDVLKVDVTGKALHDLNAKIAKLPNANTFPDYKPHVTIAYLKKGEAAKYVGDDRFQGKTITFNTLTFSPPKELRGEMGKPELPLTHEGESDAIVARFEAINNVTVDGKAATVISLPRDGNVTVKFADGTEKSVSWNSIRHTAGKPQPKGKETKPDGQKETDDKEKADATKGRKEDDGQEVLKPAPEEAAPQGAAIVEPPALPPMEPAPVPAPLAREEAKPPAPESPNPELVKLQTDLKTVEAKLAKRQAKGRPYSTDGAHTYDLDVAKLISRRDAVRDSISKLTPAEASTEVEARPVPEKLKDRKALLLSDLDTAIESAPSLAEVIPDEKVTAWPKGNKKYKGPYPLAEVYTRQGELETDPGAFGQNPSDTINKAIGDALAKAKVPKVTIEVPGKGTMDIWNTKEALTKIRDKFAKAPSTILKAPDVAPSSEITHAVGPLWHGGEDNSFTSIDWKKVKDVGFHLGHEEIAKSFDSGARPFYVDAKKPLRIEDGGERDGWAEAVANALEEQHPEADISRLRELDGTWDEYVDLARDENPDGDDDEIETAAWKEFGGDIRAAIRDAVKPYGYDSLVYENMGENSYAKGSDSFMLFGARKGQIKLAEPQLTPAQAGYASEKAARAAFESEGIKDAGETFDEFLHRRHCLGLTDL